MIKYTPKISGPRRRTGGQCVRKKKRGKTISCILYANKILVSAIMATKSEAQLCQKETRLQSCWRIAAFKRWQTMQVGYNYTSSFSLPQPQSLSYCVKPHPMEDSDELLWWITQHWDICNSKYFTSFIFLVVCLPGLGDRDGLGVGGVGERTLEKGNAA